LHDDGFAPRGIAIRAVDEPDDRDDFHGRPGEKGFVGSGQVAGRNRPDFRLDPEIPGDFENARPGDPLEDGFRESVGPDGSVFNDEEIFSGALGDPSLDVEEKSLVGADGPGLEPGDGRLDIRSAELGPHVDLAVMRPPPRAEKNPDAVDRRLAHVGSPFPNGDDELRRGSFGDQPEVSVRVVEKRPDIAGLHFVFPDGFLDRRGHFLRSIGDLHFDDIRGDEKPLDVFGKAENFRSGGRPVSPDAFKNRGPVMKSVDHRVQGTFGPGIELSHQPIFFCLGKMSRVEHLFLLPGGGRSLQNERVSKTKGNTNGRKGKVRGTLRRNPAAGFIYFRRRLPARKKRGH